MAVRTLAELSADIPGDVTRVGGPLLRVGKELALALLVLIVAVLLGVLVFALQTQPTLDQVKTLVTDDSKKFESFSQMQATWFGQVKDLLQILVISLLVPLLASVIGYMFGRQQGQTGGGGT